MVNLERRVVILGAAGMLGHALSEIFPKASLLDFRSSEKIDFVDVTSLDDLSTKLNEFGHEDWVINASAYTDVDGAETEEGARSSYNLGVIGPRNLARLALEKRFGIVHYSTAYVFNGEKGSYNELDAPSPLNNYGVHKLAGEIPILDVGGIVLRTDVLYGPNGKKSFVDAIVRKLADAPEALEVVGDQIGSPTFTNDLALMTKALIIRGTSGVYHAVNTGAISRAEMARFIVNYLRSPCRVMEISTEEYNAKYRNGKPTARRPKDCSLNLVRLNNAGIIPRTWNGALTDYIQLANSTSSAAQIQ